MMQSLRHLSRRAWTMPPPLSLLQQQPMQRAVCLSPHLSVFIRQYRVENGKNNHNRTKHKPTTTTPPAPTAAAPPIGVVTAQPTINVVSSSSTSTSVETTTTSSSSSSSNNKNNDSVVSIPPFPIRVALVSSMVGFATPLFMTIGVAQYWYHYLPKTYVGVTFKYIAGLGLGGGGVTMLYHYVLPFLQNHAEIILPFAVSNAIAAGVAYSLAEWTMGLDSLRRGVTATNVIQSSELQLRNAGADATKSPVHAWVMPLLKLVANVSTRLPFAGAAIGALSVFLSPLTWMFTIQLCIPDTDARHLLHLNDVTFLFDLYGWVLFPIAVPIGVLSGAAVQTVLEPAIVGKAGTPWYLYSLPFLVMVLLLAAAYFYFCQTNTDEYYFERRIDVVSGSVVSSNIKTGEIRHDKGHSYQLAIVKRGIFDTLRYIRDFFRFETEDTNDHNNNINKASSIYGASIDERYWEQFRQNNGVSPSGLTVEIMKQRYYFFLLLDRVQEYKYLQNQLLKTQNELKTLLKSGKTTTTTTESDVVSLNAQIQEYQHRLKKLCNNMKEDYGLLDFDFDDFMKTYEQTVVEHFPPSVTSSNNNKGGVLSFVSSSLTSSVNNLSKLIQAKNLETVISEEQVALNSLFSTKRLFSKNDDEARWKMLLSMRLLLLNLDFVHREVTKVC